MIVSDVITRVRRTFGDEAAVQVLDSDVIRWINDGQIRIVTQNDAALQTTSFISLVANQSSYTLPTDLLVLRSLRFKYAGDVSFYNIRYRNMQQFDEIMDGWDGTQYSTGKPQYFTLYENKAILFPTPDESSTNGLKILYCQKPTDVVTTADALSLPLLYHPIIVNYCLWQASLLDDDKETAVIYKGDYNENLTSLMNNETSDPVATYSTITTLAEDM
jgi:hypothetical protein